MSEDNSKIQTAQEADQTASQTTEQNAPEVGKAESRAKQKSAPRRRGGGIAWLALLLVLAVGGFTGWQWWQQEQQAASMPAQQDANTALAATQVAHEQRLTQLEARSEALEKRLDKMSSQLATLAARPERAPVDESLLARLFALEAELKAGLAEQDRDTQAAMKSGLDGLQQQLNRDRRELNAGMDALRGQLESALAGLDSRLQGSAEEQSRDLEERVARARLKLGLAEAASLLELGRSRAELDEDLPAAIAAYERADAALASLQDARLERLRRLLGEELQALRVLELPDWAGLSGRLAAMEAAVADWPLADTEAADALPVDEEEEGRGLVRGMKAALGGLVRVTPRASAPLSPEAAESVRERARLHMAALQTTLARRDAGEMAQRAAALTGLIEQHFNPSSRAVDQALDFLSSLAVSDAGLPRLGAALTEARSRLDEL